jgi:hypothetical protein
LAQNPFIQHFTTAEGLPSNGVYKVFQDSRKFIWFATDAGIARYDGSKFNFYRKQDGLSSNDIFDMFEDSFGRIWFYHINGSLNFFKNNSIYSEKNTPFLDSLKSNDFFRRFYQDDEQNIYFYYQDQSGLNLHTLDSHNHASKYILHSLPMDNEFKPRTIEGMSLRYMHKSASGEFTMWSPAGCFKTENLSEVPWLYSNDYKYRDVVTSSSNKRYIITRKFGSRKYEIKRFNGETDFDNIGSLPDVNSNFISSILEDKSGLLWISTYDKGVFCYKDEQLIHHFDIKDAKSIMQDHEENIWISSLIEGVYKISPFFNHHQHFDKSFFMNSGVFALCKSDSGGIWCTNGKMIYLLKNDEIFDLDFQQTENSFNQILQANPSTLFIGETSKLPFVLKGVRLNHAKKKITIDKAVQSHIVHKKIIVNQRRDQVSSFNQSRIFFEDSTDYLIKFRIWGVEGRIYNTYYDSNDVLIVNANRNYALKDGEQIKCPELAYFDKKVISDHLNLENKTELFNIEGDSLFLLDNKKIYNLSAALEQPVELQVDHLEYHDSTLFIATSRNIYICENPRNILRKKPVVAYMININFKSINDILFADNKLYVASNDGLTAIPYQELHDTTNFTPIPYFQSIQVNDRENLVMKDQISLVSNQRINIAFSAINYSVSPVLFSYKLEGADADWTTVKGNNVVLQNLTKGNYVFKLRSRKPTSQWSQPVEFNIIVKATIWQHPLLYFAILLLFAGMIFLIILRRKNNELNRRNIENQILLLEQKSLQAMMNPHFIFNSLGSIQNFLLHNRPNEAGIYLSQFARLIRQNLSAIDTSMINLEEEIDRLKNYLDLEKLRMGDKFVYTIEIDDNVEYEEMLIPSMIIQPFVENAIWHGIANLDENGFLSIVFILDSDKSLQIIIEDSGVGIKNAAKYSTKGENHLKLGMNITRKRLHLLGQKYGVETSFVYSERSPGTTNPGTRVVIIVPFLYGRPESNS